MKQRNLSFGTPPTSAKLKDLEPGNYQTDSSAEKDGLDAQRKWHYSNISATTGMELRGQHLI